MNMVGAEVVGFIFFACMFIIFAGVTRWALRQLFRR